MLNVRARRYNYLADSGFTTSDNPDANECLILSKIALDVSYMKPLIKERQEMLRRATIRKLTPSQYSRYIQEFYRRRKLRKKDNRTGGYIPDPFKLLRSYEDKWRVRFPDYESPWEKRGRDFKKARAKIEKGQEDNLFKKWKERKGLTVSSKGDYEEWLRQEERKAQIEFDKLRVQRKTIEHRNYLLLERSLTHKQADIKAMNIRRMEGDYYTNVRVVRISKKEYGIYTRSRHDVDRDKQWEHIRKQREGK